MLRSDGQTVLQGVYGSVETRLCACVYGCAAGRRLVCLPTSLFVGRGANSALQIDGHWHTWIDYPKFHALAKRFKETDGAAQFTALDYTAPTPDVRAVPCE